MHGIGFKALDRKIQDLRNGKSLMDRIIVLVAGDFRQTLPVMQRNTRTGGIKACIKSSCL